MATPCERYAQHRSRALTRGIPFTLSFDQWWAAWNEHGLYEARGRHEYVMAQSVRGVGFVPGNVEIVPKPEVFRRSMYARYGGEKYYHP
jgi:hypothetical protein